MQTGSATTEGLALIADPHKLAQVIRNLVSNALKFTSSGGLVTVTMSVEESNMVVDYDGVEIGTDKFIGREVFWSQFFPFFRKEIFQQKYSVPENVKHFLVLSVTDSGAGISEVPEIQHS